MLSRYKNKQASAKDIEQMWRNTVAQVEALYLADAQAAAGRPLTQHERLVAHDEVRKELEAGVPPHQIRF